jgi:hypothetical protein
MTDAARNRAGHQSGPTRLHAARGTHNTGAGFVQNFHASADIATTGYRMSIHTGDDVAPRRRDTEVQRCRNVPRGIVDQAYRHFRIVSLESFNQTPGTIGRQSVDDDDLIAIPIVLIHELLESLQDETLFVIARDNNRDKIVRHSQTADQLSE